MASLRVSLTMVVATLLFFSAASARAQEAASCTSSIRVLFNRYGSTQIPTGSVIWFSSVLEGVQSDAGDLGKTPVRIDVRQSRIAFGQWPDVIPMPDSTIMLDPSSREPERWWVGRSSWSVTYAPSQIPEAFYDGTPYPVTQFQNNDAAATNVHARCALTSAPASVSRLRAGFRHQRSFPDC